MSKDKKSSGLKRAMGAPLLAIYGAGTILGAGIFVLVGKVAGIAGYWTPLAFLLAALVATVNGMVYAELSTRHPGAGGPSGYVQKALNLKWLAILIGWMIIATGIVSGATITNGFSGYLTQFVDIPEWIARVGLLLALGTVAAIGVKESAWFMAVTTTLGVIGLGLVIYTGFFSSAAQPLSEYTTNLSSFSSSATLIGIASATFLSIYAFIGFEDMVHMAEEVKNPSRTMPRGIAIALGVAAILYLFVSIAALNVLSPETLNDSKAPLVEVVKATSIPSWIIAFLSLAIILNGALAQIIMATRVMYSLGKRGGVPHFLSKVSSFTNTPLHATIFSTSICIALALFFPLQTLASITSFIILLIFCASDISLIILEKQKPDAPFDTPKYLPWIALVLGIALLVASFFTQGGH